MMLRHLAAMGRHVATGQNTAVDPRMKGLDPSIENFRKAGEFANRFDLKAVLVQRRLGPAGGQQFDPMANQRRGQLAQARFVRYAQQRT